MTYTEEQVQALVEAAASVACVEAHSWALGQSRWCGDCEHTHTYQLINPNHPKGAATWGHCDEDGCPCSMLREDRFVPLRRALEPFLVSVVPNSAASEDE